MPIRAFISHSHKNKKLAYKLKVALKDFGIEAFLAHTDIHPSKKWEIAIKKSLRECELFIPLLTNAFRESNWTDQETGFAIALSKCVLPLRVDFNPYGFAAASQALRLKPNEVGRTCWEIVESLSQHKKFARSIRHSAIRAFLQSRSFEETEKYLSMLLGLAPFSVREMKYLLGHGANRQNIYGCYKAQDSLRKITKEMGLERSSVARRFEKAVNMWNRR